MEVMFYATSLLVAVGGAELLGAVFLDRHPASVFDDEVVFEAVEVVAVQAQEVTAVTNETGLPSLFVTAVAEGTRAKLLLAVGVWGFLGPGQLEKSKHEGQ